MNIFYSIIEKLEWDMWLSLALTILGVIIFIFITIYYKKIKKRKLVEEKKYQVEVRPDGKISFAFLEGIEVSGLTVPRVDDIVTKKLGYFVKSLARSIVPGSAHESNVAVVANNIKVGVAPGDHQSNYWKGGW